MESDPVCVPFQYLLVPAEDGAPVAVHHFTGGSDEALREKLGRYFQQSGISVGQSEEFRSHLQAQVAKQMKDAPAAAATPEQATDGLLDTMLGNSTTTFEIVPVVYPQARNDYVGTSLYVDQVGVFKELPLNSRASKIAQRPIRGDAFMLRCVDNPHSDEWCRTDCTVEHYEALLRNPPSAAPDPTAQAALLAQEAQAAGGQKELTAEQVAAAGRAKEEGNEAFKAGDVQGALDKYTSALEQLVGRLPAGMEAVAGPLAVTCRLNRAQCHLRLAKWGLAAQDCTAVLAVDPAHVKALYRRASALLHQGEFDGAEADLAAAERAGPSAEVTKLMAQVRRGREEEKKRQQQQLRKMFS